MNSFLVRRLGLFLICFICIEFTAVTYLAVDNFNNVNWSFKTIIQDLGVLQLTSFVSFLVMIFPYVIYLTFLPKKYENTKLDKTITYIVFTAFIFLNILENVSTTIFWNEFNILKNTSPETYPASVPTDAILSPLIRISPGVNPFPVKISPFFSSIMPPLSGQFW